MVGNTLYQGKFFEHFSDLTDTGPLSIDWTARIEKITQFYSTFVRIERGHDTRLQNERVCDCRTIRCIQKFDFGLPREF